MRSNYIVRIGERENEKIYAFYYIPGAGISCRIFEGSKWQPQFLVAANTRSSYTVNLSEDGYIYILAQELSGDILLYNNKNGFGRSEVLLKNQSPIIQPMLATALIGKEKNKMSLIYNSPVSEDKTQFLTMQKIDGNGEWSSPSRIDKIVSLPQEIFHKQNISDNHCAIFYTTRTPELNIGYREFTNEETGNFNLIHSTVYALNDYSFLITDNTIHTLFLLKGLFSTQLVYRKKTKSGFSEPIIVIDGQKIRDCLLYIVKNDLHVAFIAYDNLYICKSYDMGKSFERPIKYKNKFCQSPVKAIFVTPHNKMRESEYYCREVYVDNQHSHDIQILPELYEDFYPIIDTRLYYNTQNKKEHIAETKILTSEDAVQKPKNAVNNDHYDPFANMSFDNFSIKNIGSENIKTTEITENTYTNNVKDIEFSEIEILKNKLSMLIQQNRDKDRQILEIMNTLKSRNEEYIKTEQYLRNQIEMLKNEQKDKIKEYEAEEAEAEESEVIAEEEINTKSPESAETEALEPLLDSESKLDIELDKT